MSGKDLAGLSVGSGISPPICDRGSTASGGKGWDFFFQHNAGVFTACAVTHEMGRFESLRQSYLGDLVVRESGKIGIDLGVFCKIVNVELGYKTLTYL